MIQIVLKADARTRSNLRQNPVVTRSDCHELVFAEYRRCRTPTVLSETAPTLAHFRSKRYLTRWRCSLTLLALCSKLWIRTVPLVSVGGRLERIPRDNRSRAAVTSSERTCISWGQQSGSSALVFMQPSNSQSCSDRRQDRFRVASGPRSIPPGALAGYLQAQQAWRKAQANARHTESSGTQQCQTSVLRGSASANSTNSCSTSDRRLEVYGTCNLPALGCKTVARLFERRHELMVRHRHQRQAAKRRKLSAAAPEAPSGLLGLPEDVLLHIVYKLEHEDIEPLFRVCQVLCSMMHTAMLLHFTYITPHRQPFDAHPRITVKKRAMTRAQPASSSSSRCQAKSCTAPRALQFADAPEVSTCTEQFGLMGPFDSPNIADEQESSLERLC